MWRNIIVNWLVSQFTFEKIPRITLAVNWQLPMENVLSFNFLSVFGECRIYTFASHDFMFYTAKACNVGFVNPWARPAQVYNWLPTKLMQGITLHVKPALIPPMRGEIVVYNWRNKIFPAEIPDNNVEALKDVHAKIFYNIDFFS